MREWHSAGTRSAAAELRTGIASYSTAGVTVLLAEDEDGIRALCAMVLQRQGYRVLQARDGCDALRLALQYDGPIHLLLTDIMMPGLDGVRLGESVARVHPETKVILMSGVPWNRTHAQFAFLQKPFAFPMLLSKIREVLEARRAS